tara:strand:- start:6 stop:299 length:294 start_codon:yes stop_codon:yes gene_type:complete
MPAETFCVKLYCDFPSLLSPATSFFSKKEIEKEVSIQELNRDILDSILKSCKGEYLGSGGRATTWNIPSNQSSKLLKKIQAYNSRKEFKHIIYLELY